MLDHLLHPLTIYAMPPLPAPARLRVLPPDAVSGITPLLRQWLLDAAERVQAIGFGAPLYVTSGRTLNHDAAVALFERPDERAIAFLRAAEGPHTAMQVSISITTWFADGLRLNTGNSPVVLRTPSRPGADGLNVAGCSDLARLWAIHDFRVRTRERQVPLAPTTRGGDPVGFQFDEERVIHEHWVASGYFRPLPDGSLSRTMKGATLGAWRGLWPWKQATRHDNRRRAAMIIAAMDT